MNAESFVQYVQQLSRLYQLPYEELKSLSMQYPYFQNLHLLLALKSKLEDHPDYPRNLARASTYSVDRAQLYRTLTKLEKLVLEDNFLIHEEVLELQEITRLEEKLKDLELIPESSQDLPSNNQLADPITTSTAPIVNQEVEKEDFNSPKVTPLAIVDQEAVLPKASTTEAPAAAVNAYVDDTLVKNALALSLLLEEFYQKKQVQMPEVEAQTSISEVASPTLPSPKIEEDLVANMVAASTILETLQITAEEAANHLEEDPQLVKPHQTPKSETEISTLLLDAIAVTSVLDRFHSKIPAPKNTIPQAAPEPISPPTSKLNLELNTKQLKKQLKKIKRKKPKPMPKKSFSTWIEQFQPAHVKPHLGDLMEAKKKEKLKLISSKSDPTKLQGDNLNFFAQKSILENKEMASETLAEILVAQMQYQKAIKVYERLILIFPEKSAFFAGKIENLKKLTS